MAYSKERHDGTWWWIAPWRTRETPKVDSETPWCTRSAINIYKRAPAPTARYRCKDCGRLLTLMTIDIEEGYGDFWLYVPPHKRKSVEVIKSKAHTARKRKKNRTPRRGK